MTEDAAAGNEIGAIIGTLATYEVATFQWLMDEIRERFGASDRFDPQDPAFGELARQLASKVL